MIEIIGVALLGICYCLLIASVVGRNPAIILVSVTVTWLFLCQSPLYPVYFKLLSTGRWFFLTALVFVFLAAGVYKGSRMRLSRIVIFPIVFFVYFYATKEWSINPDLTVDRSISVLLLACVVIFIVRYIGDSIDRRNAVIKAVIFPIPLVFWVLTLVYGFDLSYIERGLLRTSGPMLNPNGIGVLGALMAPAAYYLLKSGCGMKKYWVFCVVTFILMLLMSGSRGSLISLIAAFIVVAISSKKKSRNAYLFISIGAVMMLGLLALDSDSINNFMHTYIRRDSLSTGSGRLEAWGSALEILKLSPWVGYGFGVEDRIFNYYGVRFLEHHGSAVHNSYLGLSIQVGIPAAIIFYVPLILVTIRSYKNCIRYGDKHEVILVACIVAGLTLGIWESWLYSAGSTASLPFWIIFGVMVRSFGTKNVIQAGRTRSQRMLHSGRPIS